ncbi:MAG: DUF4315 family protein [Clostridiales bacterium]|nr:DUF4315 family protein [Clostridiales bacterium]
MATVEKIEKDIIRTKEKIAELQKKLRTLEMQRKEAESLEVVNLVRAVKMDNATLTVFLKAYAKGDIELPEEYKAELEAASGTEVEETEDSEDEE